ncbi:hypothetical protein [Streptomyces sp. SA15]|uniref:hypothetical protein n=1 Tax=Streptomyces sp. SA15 TaxID=934019 RepID=UPI00211B9F66|nr:hypothetical protein [Streptomyces sp. SA15]
MRPGIPVCVHDVFHGRRPLPFTEGAVVLRWLAAQENTYFTASRAHAPEMHHRLNDVKRTLALGHPLRDSKDNPMIFFTLCIGADTEMPPAGQGGARRGLLGADPCVRTRGPCTAYAQDAAFVSRRSAGRSVNGA